MSQSPNTDTPQITVVMPAYNAAAFLARAIQSVQVQTRGDWELIVVDDFSVDATLQIATEMAADDARIVVLHQPQNSGPAAARNRAIHAGQGRYVAFLDADDCWLPQKLERQIAFMEEKGHAFTFTDYWRINGASRRRVTAATSVSYAELLKGNTIGCLTTICDRSVLGSFEMPDLPMRQDYGLWLDLLKRTPAAYGLQEPLAEYHDHAGSLSTHKWRALVNNWRLLYRVEGLSMPVTFWYLGHVIFNRVKRAFAR